MKHRFPRIFVNYLIIGLFLFIGLSLSSCAKDVQCPSHGGGDAKSQMLGDDEEKGKGLGDRSRKRDKNGLIKK